MKKGAKITIGVLAVGAVAFTAWKLSKGSANKISTDEFNKDCLRRGGTVALSGKVCLDKGQTFSTTNQTADIFVGDIGFK